MTYIGKRCISALAVLLLAAACTTEQGYNAVKGWQKNECNHRVDNRDREECLKQTDTSYEEYNKQKSQ